VIPAARRRLVAGNWKLAKTNDEAGRLVRALLAELLPGPGVDVVLCPPFTALSEASYLLAGTPIGLGAQDLYWENEGAFTGEVSGPMLVSAGCRFVLVGHSERRQFFGETDATVAKKTRAALDAGLAPIVCLGESLEEREGGRTFDVVEAQFDRGLGALSDSDASRLVLAYEPVWAIGTGKNATPGQAAEVHARLRARARARWPRVAESLRILYGGSVKPDNAAALAAEPELDGALVGGASLLASSFVPIVHCFAAGAFTPGPRG
jgi:triosephosphate isomerase